MTQNRIWLKGGLTTFFYFQFDLAMVVYFYLLSNHFNENMTIEVKSNKKSLLITNPKRENMFYFNIKMT